MKKIKQTIKNSFIGGIVFSVTVMGFGLVYAAFQNIDQVSSGGTLLADSYNKLITNQEDLKSRLDTTDGEIVSNDSELAAISSKLNSIDLKQLPTSRVYFDGTDCTGTCTIKSSYNIDRVERVTDGKYNVYFSTPMDNINYAFMEGSVDASDHSSLTRWITPLSRNTTYVQIITEYSDGRNLNHTDISIATYGGIN